MPVMMYNAGRWMVMCDEHLTASAVLALDYHATDPEQSVLWTEDNQYICPVCYPGIKARIPFVNARRIVDSKWDESARATARLMAREDGKLFTVEFPEEREEIEQILAVRPKLQQNWMPGETLEFLKAENKLLGIEV